MNSQSCVNIRKELDIVGARQLGREITKQVGFGIVDQARVTTAISELARNIYLYTEDGEICCEPIEEVGRKGIRVVSKDQGNGIADLSTVMRDGYSTSGGLGAGLPGVRRLMDEFDIQTEVGIGTVISTVKWLR